MSRRTKQPQAAAAEFGFAETGQRVVSNTIFYCGGDGPNQSKPPGEQQRCLYGAGGVRKLVHDPAAGSSGVVIGKPLPLPPCRPHHRGASVGPAVLVGGPRGRLLSRRVHAHHHHDPFLAAYVTCSESSGGEHGSVKEKEKRQHVKKKKKTRNAKGHVVQGRGIWDGWAARAKCAGAAMSCKNGGTVVDVRGRDDAPDAAAKEESEAPLAGPTLDLSWTRAVLSARALERRREQR